MTFNLKTIYLYLRYVCFYLYYTILCYIIVNVKPCVTELKKWFIFFINIISVQVNQSALLNVLKKIKVNWKKSQLLFVKISIYRETPGKVVFISYFLGSSLYTNLDQAWIFLFSHAAVSAPPFNTSKIRDGSREARAACKMKCRRAGWAVISLVLFLT